MRRLILLLSFLLVYSSAVQPAQAVTDGELDRQDHPYVGLMVAKDENGIPLWRCSGTLLSPTLFLTAGHCTSGADQVEFWFDAGPIPLAEGYPAAGDQPCAGVVGYPCTGDVSGTPYTHPDFDENAFFLHDLGVVVLDDPVVMPEYGELPELGQLDSLTPSSQTTFTAVGYGLQKSFPDAAASKDEATRVRMVAHPHLLQINRGIVGDFAILLSANARTGGTCFGDSGGPNFIGDSNVIAGVTSFARNGTCAGTGGVYRVDQPDDLGWLFGEFGDLL